MREGKWKYNIILLFPVGALRLYLFVLFLFKTGRFGLNIGLKSCFVVTQFPQKGRPKGMENAFFENVNLNSKLQQNGKLIW